MTMPDPGTTMHVAAVDYVVTFAELNAAAAPAKFAAPGGSRYTFTFDTGSAESPPGTWTVTWTAAWFTQATVETAIASTLTGVCTSVASMLGLTLAQVQAAVTIRRLWTMGQNAYSIIPGVSSGAQQVVIPDVMTYPLPP